MPDQKLGPRKRRASPPSLLSVCFHSSPTSVSPPPMCSCWFHCCQGLLCFSFGWPWNMNFISSLRHSPPYPAAVPGPRAWALPQKPDVFIISWKWSQYFLSPGWGSVEDPVGGQAREGESRKLWLNQVVGVRGCLIVTSLYGQCLQPPVTKRFITPRSDLSFSSFCPQPKPHHTPLATKTHPSAVGPRHWLFLV